MSHLPDASVPDSRSVRLQLGRILASEEFASAPRMQQFLRVIVAETIEGRGDTLKEYFIGVTAFDRPPAFNPGLDPIVRVEARRLRKKLARYYEHAGRTDPVVIELPKGRYTPAFRINERTAEAPAREIATVAVLPFQNLAQSKDGEYFAEGLTWELIHRLTRVRDIAVVAWTSVEQVRGAADTAAAGVRLHASRVVTGSVRQAGDRVRIVAQLVNASDGVYLWSETYDRRLEDVFSIQEDIANEIVRRLEARLRPAAAPALSSRRYSPEAYRVYVHGRAHWNRRTRDGLLESLRLFQEAARIDPGFALAYAGIADACLLMSDYAVKGHAEAIGAAKEAAAKALELDPTLGEAHCSLGLILAACEWKWVEAESHFRRALDLNPGYATAHHWIGIDYLAVVGRFEEAAEETEIARRLDPLSLIISEGWGYLLMLRRRFDDSLAHFRKMIAAHPDFYKGHSSMGRTLIQLGRYGQALEALDRAMALGGRTPSILGAMGQALALKGERGRARDILDELSSTRERAFVPSTCFAMVHMGLGEKERALDWLDNGLDAHEMSVCLLRSHPAFDSLRSEGRFRAMLERLGLDDGAGEHATSGPD